MHIVYICVCVVFVCPPHFFDHHVGHTCINANQTQKSAEHQNNLLNHHNYELLSDDIRCISTYQIHPNPGCIKIIQNLPNPARCLGFPWFSIWGQRFHPRNPPPGGGRALAKELHPGGRKSCGAAAGRRGAHRQRSWSRAPGKKPGLSTMGCCDSAGKIGGMLEHSVEFLLRSCLICIDFVCFVESD